MATISFSALLSVMICLAGIEARRKPEISLMNTLLEPIGTLAPNTDCKQKEISCLDCNTLLTCINIGGNNFLPLKAEACNASKPYCSNGVCSTTPPTTSCAPTPSDTFTCKTGSGYFPDATDCTKYHFCAKTKAFDYDCSKYGQNMVYDHSIATCAPRTNANCYTFPCGPNDVGSYTAYKADNNIYGVCMPGGSVTLLKCPPGMRWNPTGLNCEIYCSEPGLFPDSTDTRKERYYECVRLSNNALSLPRLQQCPQGSNFDTTRKRCQELQGNSNNGP